MSRRCLCSRARYQAHQVIQKVPNAVERKCRNSILLQEVISQEVILSMCQHIDKYLSCLSGLLLKFEDIEMQELLYENAVQTQKQYTAQYRQSFPIAWNQTKRSKRRKMKMKYFVHAIMRLIGLDRSTSTARANRFGKN